MVETARYKGWQRVSSNLACRNLIRGNGRKSMRPLSSSGLGHRLFMPGTGVQFPVGVVGEKSALLGER